ncbi:DUF4129 domain-containing protein [Salinirubrum litoreum]|uniref:DUF4129 domain-containing protein n=1 Tax=Salinirubrum litoreum TaxID=1126234 RepID=A0ABD5RC45_9EURY|nr:DUF4129 domain-containing protein [Salinirubrum litoreum]
MTVTADRLLTVAVALVCLFAVGSGAASLDSAVDASPGEAIDVDYASLPIESDDAGQLKQQYNDAKNDATEQTGGGSGSADDPPDGGQGDPPPGGENGDEPEDASFIGDDPPPGGGEGQNDDGRGPGTGSDDPLDSLLSALGALLSALVTVLAGLLLLVGAALAVRHRDRLRARLRALLDRLGVGGSENDPREHHDAPRGVPDPQNPVSRAWVETMERVGVDAERALTPRERAALATDRGADPEAIWSLTALFEEVTYGGAPVTEQRRERATHHLSRLREGGDDS